MALAAADLIKKGDAATLVEDEVACRATADVEVVKMRDIKIHDSSTLFYFMQGIVFKLMLPCFCFLSAFA